MRILVFFFIWSFRAALGAFFDMFWLFEGVSLPFWRSKTKLATVCFSLYSKYRAFHYRLLMMTWRSSVVALTSTWSVRIYIDLWVNLCGSLESYESLYFFESLECNSAFYIRNDGQTLFIWIIWLFFWLNDFTQVKKSLFKLFFG